MKFRMVKRQYGPINEIKFVMSYEDRKKLANFYVLLAEIDKTLNEEYKKQKKKVKTKYKEEIDWPNLGESILFNTKLMEVDIQIFPQSLCYLGNS